MQKQTWKLVVSFVSTIIMVSLAVGCASESGSTTAVTTSTADSSAVGGTVTSEQLQSSGNEDTITLTLWCQSVNQPEYFQWVKEEFEKTHKGIELKIEAQPHEALGDQLDVTLGGDNAPDIVATWGGLVASKLYKGNRIVDLSDVITPEIEELLVDAATYNKMDGEGKYVTLPLIGFASPVIYYNKTEFKALGLEVPSTYDELVELATAIRAAGKQPLIAGMNTWHMPHFMQAIHARTMSVENFDKLMGKPKDFNPYELPGVAEGFALLKQYNEDKIFADNIIGYDANMAQMEFIGQSALMLTAPTLDLYTLEDAAEFELGVFLLPPGDVAGPLVSGVYVDVLAINSKSAHINEAKALFTFLLTSEAQSKLLEFDLFPVSKDVDIGEANPILADVVKAIKTSGVSGFYQNFSAPAIDVQIVNAGGSLLAGEIDFQQAAEILADYYKTEVMDK